MGTEVTEENWTSFVAGLVVTNDVSARDMQLPKTQFFESKSYPTFTPVGPALVLLDDDELKRFGDLRLRLWVNGELRQDAVVDGDMIYSPLEALQALSRFQRLDAGRPAPHRHPGGHRPERAAEAGRDHRRVPAARAEVEALLPAPGPEPQVPQARRRRRGRHRHRRRCHRPRPAAHRRQERLMGDLLWPTYDGPGDLAAIEAVPLADRGLPGTTYELLVRAAGLWPDRVALSVLPDGDRWEQPSERTFAELLADVHRYANVFHALGVRRTDGVALLAPNCDELITATLAAELAGIAAPINSGLSREHIAELLRRSGARVLVAAGPDLAPEVWDHARDARRRGRDRGAARPAPDRGGPAEAELRPDRRRAGRPPVRAGGGAASRPLRGGAALGHRPRRCLPHRWHDGHAEARRAHPRQRGHRRLDDRRHRACWTPTRWSFAALPLFHVNALVVTLLAPLFKGQRVVWAGPLGYRDTHAVRELLEAGRALPHQLHERRADHLRRPRRPPRRRRHQQPALRPRRRLPLAAGRPGEVRVRHRGAPDRGLRPDRGDLRQRPQLRGPPRPRIRRPAPALPAGEDHRGQCRRAVGRPADR